MLLSRERIVWNQVQDEGFRNSGAQGSRRAVSLRLSVLSSRGWRLHVLNRSALKLCSRYSYRYAMLLKVLCCKLDALMNITCTFVLFRPLKNCAVLSPPQCNHMRVQVPSMAIEWRNLAYYQCELTLFEVWKMHCDLRDTECSSARSCTKEANVVTTRFLWASSQATDVLIGAAKMLEREHQL